MILKTLKEWEENIIEPVDYSYYGLTLKNTCVLCPEQYDVYYGDTLCGYMKLRHGYFRTEYYENPEDEYGLSEDIVYHSDTKGGGRFLCEEREEHLKRGAEAIIKRIDTTPKDCYNTHKTSKNYDYNYSTTIKETCMGN